MDFQQLARETVSRAHPEFDSSTLYVVWFAKTLDNWKALISTDVVNGSYWEVTHNGNKNETYVDWYQKIENTVVPD